MSRGLRLLPVILLVWILIAFAWRLIQPNDPTIHSRLVNRGDAFSSTGSKGGNSARS